MIDPFIFVTTHTINDGELENIEALGKAFTEFVESRDTGLVAFHFYLSADGSQVSNVQVHTDAASMDEYLPVVRELIGEALQSSQTTSIEVFGTPGPVLREVLRANEEQGVAVHLMSNHLDGFTRRLAA